MSLPDGWRALERDKWWGPGEIAKWTGPGREGAESPTVILHESGHIEVQVGYDSEASFPVELLEHISAAWHNHQRSRAP